MLSVNTESVLIISLRRTSENTRCMVCISNYPFIQSLQSTVCCHAASLSVCSSLSFWIYLDKFLFNPSNKHDQHNIIRFSCISICVYA